MALSIYPGDRGGLSNKMKICVFLSATNSSEFYAAPVRDLAERITSGGHGVVWGGSDAGLMKILADATQDAGGSVTGVSIESLRWVLREKLNEHDEIVVTANLPERKALLLERSDVVIVMPGGTGTLDEFTDILELRRHGTHDKPIVVVDYGGFYEGLRLQLDRMQTEGFLDHPYSSIVEFVADPEAAMNLIEGLR